jgi:hypothetical protein
MADTFQQESLMTIATRRKQSVEEGQANTLQCAIVLHAEDGTRPSHMLATIHRIAGDNMVIHRQCRVSQLFTVDLI